ncbi:MAG: SDR family oxidoreductase [Dehalococcoidia bacterium]
MDLELTGKAALVTGGSKGIGKAVALELAREGADVAICARTQDALEATARDLAQQTGRRVVPIVADVSQAADVDRLVEATVEALGRLDILVNNAGMPGGLTRAPVTNVTDEAMMEDLNVKFMGVLRCARAAVPHMQRQGFGRIINIAGQSARQSGTYSTGVRNIAIVHLSKALSDELGSSGITVNVVHPGLTRTEYVDAMVAARAKEEGASVDEMEQRMTEHTAIRRIVDAREIAYLVAYLASPKAACITGEVIGANGGSSRAVFT